MDLCLSFDTSATNMSKHKEMITLLNDHLQNPTLLLPCRHKIYKCHIKMYANN